MTSLYAFFHMGNYNDNYNRAYADGQDHLLIRMNSKKGNVTNIFVVTRMDSANDFQA